MKMYHFAVVTVLALSSCATMNESLELGAGMGAATGIAAVYSGRIGSEQQPSFQDVAISAGIGSAFGLLTSYLVHGSVEESRQSQLADQIDMNFGDLPPSPFIIPRNKSKKGMR
ncbi:MAG: hypothetical protein KA715_10895 [Xanthomonadaceae bacterium]|nr:hypothetical protein [Xanthomonadaceae bacterium]